MTAEYTIRRAMPSDLEIIVAFTVQEATETEGVAPDLDAIQRGVQAGLEDSGLSRYWVAETPQGDVVASISVVTEWSNYRGGFYWWIQSLFISPDHRGKGLVDLLLDFIAEAAQSAGALELRLYALQSNRRAIAAYVRCNFEVAPYTIMVRRSKGD